MMDAISLISQDLFDKVRSRFSNLEMGDENGNKTSDPREARFFDFDFVMENVNLGRVSISINERGSLKVFYSQGILEGIDPISHKLWFDFLREMRNFSKRRLLRFDTRDITKSNLNKTDFQYLASVGTKEDSMSESRKWSGSSKSSYKMIETATVIVRHSAAVNEEQRGARTRKIDSIYIESQHGERFKMPIISLRAAEAMARHVANEGNPYDQAGKAIIEMATQISQLSAFKKHCRNHVQTEAAEIVNRAGSKLKALKTQLESISKQRHYEVWIAEAAKKPKKGEKLILDKATLENYKSKFTVSSFAEDLTQYFPLIHSIMQETSEVDLDQYVNEAEGCVPCTECNQCDCQCDHDEDKEKEVKEFGEFESWAKAVAEGNIEPDTLASLKDLLDGKISLGVDAIDAIESLQGIGIHDSNLEAALNQLAKVNPEADPAPTIMAWLEKEDPEAAKEFSGSTEEPPAETPPAEEPPAEEPPAEEPPEQAPNNQIPQGQPTAEEKEEDTKKSDKFNIKEVSDMVMSFFDKKKRTFPLGHAGVITKVRKEFGDKAAKFAENIVYKVCPKDDTVPTEEGMAGAVAGGVAGAALTKSPSGTMTGAEIGSKVQDMMTRESLGDILRLSGLKK